VAVAGSVLSIVLTLLLLPGGNSDIEESPRLRRTTSMTKLVNPDVEYKIQHSDAILGLGKVFGMVWLLLSTKVVTSLANAISASAMPLILKDTYHMNEV
jgi:hypothetical protein